MKGKIILITGASDGIGKQVARELSILGAHVIMHGRNYNKTELAADEIRKATGGQIDTIIADLSSFSQIREMSVLLHEKYDRLDVLINNAGVQMHTLELSEDGFEMSFAINHLAYFLLTSLLIDLIDNSEYRRIVITSSGIHSESIDFDNLQAEKGYNMYSVYTQTKLCNLFFAYHLADLLINKNISVNSLHPGLVDTNLNPQRSAEVVERALPVTKGSIATMYLTISPDLENVTGKYFNYDASEVKSKPISYDKQIQQRLWTLSEEMIGEKFKLL